MMFRVFILFAFLLAAGSALPAYGGLIVRDIAEPDIQREADMSGAKPEKERELKVHFGHCDFAMPGMAAPPVSYSVGVPFAILLSVELPAEDVETRLLECFFQFIPDSPRSGLLRPPRAL